MYYIPIFLTIGLIILVTLNIIKPRWYPPIIYLVALGALYSTTLPGLSVNAIDSARELLMSKLALANGWDTTLYDPSNTSFVVGLLIPSLSLLFNISPEWVYKAIIPTIFALCPVILYLVFRKQLDSKLKAFYASMFFVMMPVFSLEIGSIAKSMVAETLMALCLWVMYTEWKSWKKCVMMIILAILTMWAHYTVGILLCAFLGCGLAAKWFYWILSKVKKFELLEKRSVQSWVIMVVLLCVVVPSYFYYSSVAKGLIYNSVSGTAGGGIFKQHTEQELKQAIEAKTLMPSEDNMLLRLALAKDFGEVPLEGKLFRIIQYLTQLLIVVGSIWLLFKYRLYKFKIEFLACIGSSFAILFLCIALPSFATIINATRWFHMTLFFLAPMFVLGFDWIRAIPMIKECYGS
jgi:uncharacterized membrane protein